MNLIICISLISAFINAYINNEDILQLKRHLIIYADGIAKELIDAKMPVINSWRPQIFEVRNLCKIIDCNYMYPSESNFPHKYQSNKCYIESDAYCKTTTERNAVFKLEEILHESDFSTSIELGGEKFGIIGNCKTEDAVIFEIGDTNTTPENKSEEQMKKLLKE